MTSKIGRTPSLPKVPNGLDDRASSVFLQRLVRSVYEELIFVMTRAAACLPFEGTEPMTGPLRLATYTVATVPTASAHTGGLIYVSNETGGAVPAFSDGTNWRRVTDRAVVS